MARYLYSGLIPLLSFIPGGHIKWLKQLMYGVLLRFEQVCPPVRGPGPGPGQGPGPVPDLDPEDIRQVKEQMEIIF